MRIVPILFSLLLVGATKPAAKPVDWTRVVTMTHAGSYVIGNPAAKVRVAEYMSYTCSHCADFAAKGGPPMMQNYVSKGTVSFEIRNFLLNGLDFTAALAARCGGPSRFKGNHDALFAAQQAIMTKGQSFNAAAYDKNPLAGIKAWARFSGITDLMAKRGIPADVLDKCIGDAREQQRIQGMTREAAEVRKIPGTPYFYVNDKVIEGNTWASVEPALRAALKL